MPRVSKSLVWAVGLNALFVLASGACSRGGSQAPASAPAPMTGGASEGATPQSPTPPTPQPTEAAPAPPAVEAPGGFGSGAPHTGSAGSPRSGSSNPFDEHNTLGTNAAPGECQTDRDCLCGIDRASGACAVGAASRIDTDRQCPDFCSGISGQRRTVCDRGRCAQTP